MRRVRILPAALALCLLTAGCGSEAAVAPPPAPDRNVVVTDIHLSGEYLSPTPAPSQTAVPPTPRPTLRATVGAIAYQTPTAVSTGAPDVRDVANDSRFNPPQPAANATEPPPGQASVSIGQGAPIYPTATPTTAPPAATATPVTLATGQSMPLNLPAGTNNCDTSETFKFYYPGDNSAVTIDAQFNGLVPSNLGTAGINVWDSTSSSAPIANATSLTNQKNSVPGSVELSYSRLIGGPVTIELYNWSQTQLTGTVTVVNLASNGSPLQFVSAKSPGAC
jgi:hypothetical protein